MSTIYIATKGRLMREALAAALQHSGEFTSVHCEAPEDAIAQLQTDDDALLITDDAELISQVRAIDLEARLVLFSNDGTFPGISAQQYRDANGAFTGADALVTVIQALQCIGEGERVVRRDLPSFSSQGNGHAESEYSGESAAAADGLPFTRKASNPSPRETEILHYLLRGDSNKQIARALGITEATVKVHLKGLLRKIRVTNRTQAALWAMQNGFTFEGTIAPYT